MGANTQYTKRRIVDSPKPGDPWPSYIPSGRRVKIRGRPRSRAKYVPLPNPRATEWEISFLVSPSFCDCVTMISWRTARCRAKFCSLKLVVFELSLFFRSSMAFCRSWLSSGKATGSKAGASLGLVKNLPIGWLRVFAVFWRSLAAPRWRR